MEIAFVVAIAMVALVAFAVGRMWILGFAFVVVPMIYVGLGRGWWGHGLGDGWGVVMVLVLALAVGAASIGLAGRSLTRRR